MQEFLGISSGELETAATVSRGVSQEQGPLTRLRPRGSYIFTRHKAVRTYAGDE